MHQNLVIDIKTIIGRFDWASGDVSRLVKKIENKYKKAMLQTDNGIVFISFWSQNMNNLFRDYFHLQHKTVPYELENKSCYFVLDGLGALEDFYTSKHVFDLTHDLPTCDFITKYRPQTYPSPYRYFQLGRSGFPIGTSNSDNTSASISLSFG